MNNLSKKQQKIAKRQEMLKEIMPNAISCDYIASVNRHLPDGFEVKTITLNHNGCAWYMTAYRGKEFKILVSNDYVNIQNVPVHYITL
jgi:hypothetical protein